MALQLDWDKVLDEAQRHFIELLKLDTTNPPGNETIAIDYIKAELEKEGLKPTVIESAPGRSNLVCRQDGKRNDTGLLLTSHVDVVPVERDQWRCDPFGGEIHDGDIYGRGAIDMKNMTAYGLIAFLTAKRLGWDLQHDLVLSAFADEEAGCNYGSRFMVDNHPDLLSAKFAFNEIGGFTIHTGGTRIYPIQVVEKGFVWLKMRVGGDPGHGSMPHDNNAVVKLARAVEKLGRRVTPMHLNPIVDEFLAEMGDAMGGASKTFLKLAKNPRLSDLVTKTIMHKKDPDKARVIYASLHNTVNPTGLSAGSKVNVIPSVAEAVLDCRTLPGVTVEQLLKEITDIIGPGFEFEIINKGMAPTMNHETYLYQILKETITEADPGGKAVPYLVVGFTDSSELARLGITCYGFTPIQLAEDVQFATLFHGHNERLGVEGFRWGVKTFMEAVYRYCVTG